MGHRNTKAACPEIYGPRGPRGNEIWLCEKCKRKYDIATYISRQYTSFICRRCMHTMVKIFHDDY